MVPCEARPFVYGALVIVALLGVALDVGLASHGLLAASHAGLRLVQTYYGTQAAEILVDGHRIYNSNHVPAEKLYLSDRIGSSLQMDPAGLITTPFPSQSVHPHPYDSELPGLTSKCSVTRTG